LQDQDADPDLDDNWERPNSDGEPEIDPPEDSSDDAPVQRYILRHRPPRVGANGVAAVGTRAEGDCQTRNATTKAKKRKTKRKVRGQEHDEDVEGEIIFEARGTPPDSDQIAAELVTSLSNLSTSDNNATIENLVSALSSQNGTLLSSIPGALAGLSSGILCPETHASDEELEHLIQSYTLIEGESHLLDFFRMISLIRIAILVDQESRAFPSTQIAMDSLANRHKITVSLLAKYRHFGQRLLCLANAGSLYIILIAAALGLFKELNRRSIPAQPIISVAKILRRPLNDKSSILVKEQIIPKIVELMKHDSLKGRLWFPTGGNNSKAIEFSLMAETDIFFGDIATQ
ncbi:hypothetical protein H0H81_007158, partial [Sphagnurus paluster]